MRKGIRLTLIVSFLCLLFVAAGRIASAQGLLLNRSYALPGRPISVVVGDFDGAGPADLAVASYSDEASNISILLGMSGGTFHEALNFDGGNGAQTLAVGDFNGDGKSDLAASAIRFDLMIYLGNGNGTFQPAAVNV